MNTSNYFSNIFSSFLGNHMNFSALRATKFNGNGKNFRWLVKYQVQDIKNNFIKINVNQENVLNITKEIKLLGKKYKNREESDKTTKILDSHFGKEHFTC